MTCVGNGYFGTRGCMEEMKANDVNYPGTYMPALFDKQMKVIAGRDIWNEDFVNAPNWLYTNVKVPGGDYINFANIKLERFFRQMSLRDGRLRRKIIIEDANGKRTLIYS